MSFLDSPRDDAVRVLVAVACGAVRRFPLGMCPLVVRRVLGAAAFSSSMGDRCIFAVDSEMSRLSGRTKGYKQIR